MERSDRMWPTGEENGKPLQYFCLENPMNGERLIEEKDKRIEVLEMLVAALRSNK